mmetsp:Transcript_91730/g.159091  ORF Transcript_91730/g.159091 Transcript_91730/m.159091 type:complete len:101 (-) Transcript_91730:636-938(-)
MAAKGGDGAVKTNAVDADKLWVDRIKNELKSQKEWAESYEYLIKDGVQTKEERLKQLEKDLGGTQVGFGSIKSTAKDSFQQRPTLERFGPSAHGRKKHDM